MGERNKHILMGGLIAIAVLLTAFSVYAFNLTP
jgi:hypothetical protein